MNLMSSKRILVTGAAGFIGSNLCDYLLAEGYEVIGFDNLSTGNLNNLKVAKENKNFKFYLGDICTAKALEIIDVELSAIVHLAALADIVPSIKQPEAYFHANVVGTFNIANYARAMNVPKILYAASSSCYGIPKEYPTSESAEIDPRYPYALTKRLGEEILLHWGKVYGIKVKSLRLFNVYGPRSRTSGNYGAVFGVFLAQKLAEEPFTVVGDGNQTRDFTFVSDVARAFHLVLERESNSDIYNVGSGKKVSINRLVELLGGKVEYIPKRPGEPDCTQSNSSRIESDFGWNPQVSIEEGVGIMLSLIGEWQNAPLWNSSTIAAATEDWFKYLGKDVEI
jgi:UDP-glucose 4-epimerase